MQTPEAGSTHIIGVCVQLLAPGYARQRDMRSLPYAMPGQLADALECTSTDKCVLLCCRDEVGRFTAHYTHPLSS